MNSTPGFSRKVRETDLLMIQQLGESLAPPAGDLPADLRRRVLAAAVVHGDQPRRSRTRLAWPGLRVAWRLGVPAGVAAAIVAGLLVLIGLPNAGNAPAPPGPGPGPVDAAQVLRLAAQHAAAAPVLVARPDQFVYVEDVWVVGGQTLRSQSWLSVDGTRDGLGIGPQSLEGTGPGCRDGRMVFDGDPAHTVACTPRPALDPDLPTDSDALRAYLYRPERDQVRDVTGAVEDVYPPGTSADEIAWMRLAELLRTSYSPAVHAAAFQAASTMPGGTVVNDAHDVSGRAAVAVTVGGAAARIELLFDPSSYAYLGHNLIRLPAGELIRGRAALRIAVTDEVGQLPG